ncbi:hypothetical protein [Pseudoscardovia suis]|uniref:Uncharacterized protein n=1 Tax=Pseudoscardovia suis TaxID=987063 RepID=A0A261F4F4_9BIFI|nr:hypothetical protein [Pseudoscardovia suis]OZG54000.1 hypothetical protein PSSU_0103 [Pseudoscardovia suis]PJJ65761.1 hypothetical protein CLV65_1323 [Pseudoscardovia suis]
MKHDELVDSRVRLTSLLQLLYGIPTDGTNRYECLIVTDELNGEKPAGSEYGFSDESRALLVAPNRPDGWKGDYLAIDGGIGHEGDQAIVDGSMIVETVSYSVLPYLQISGPTYVVVESEGDCTLFNEDCRRFSRTGCLPEYVTVPGIIMEVGSAFDCPRNIGMKRFFVHDNQKSNIPGTGPSAIAHRSDDLCVKTFLAAVFIVQASASDSQIVFSCQPDDTVDSELLLAFDETNRNGTAINVRSGHVYRISADAFRVLKAARRGVPGMNAIADEFDLGVSQIEQERNQLLGRMGIHV